MMPPIDVTSTIVTWTIRAIAKASDSGMPTALPSWTVASSNVPRFAGPAGIAEASATPDASSAAWPIVSSYPIAWPAAANPRIAQPHENALNGSASASVLGRPATRKIAHLRRNPTATFLWRAGWAWVAVEGSVDLFGPDDPLEGVAGSELPRLLRQVYSAAGGGQHEDWAEYDRVISAERRMAVLLTPKRIYVNP